MDGDLYCFSSTCCSSVNFIGHFLSSENSSGSSDESVFIDEGATSGMFKMLY